mgnify:CR=1 FL=1
MPESITNLKSTFEISKEMSEKIFVIPPNRTRYLSEISENNRAYDKWAIDQKDIAQKLYALQKSLEILSDASEDIITQIKSAWVFFFIIKYNQA